LDLCSTLLWRHRDPVEQLQSPEDMARWRLAAGLGTSTSLTEHDVLETRSLREAIYRLMTARITSQRLPPGDIAIVNAAAGRPCRAPRLGPAGQLDWAPAEPLSAALSAIARDAIDLISGANADRIRECAAPDCAFLFLDTSRPGTRRWCAMNRCGNREHVRRHRSRTPADGHNAPNGGHTLGAEGAHG
jgi:predicted RNA-binding Zn ribbon-like protein